ncbi:hypothetical protein JRO89_XS09G0004900 [Xanthoceras sorbifolium]|uniref:Molybdenum cofactor sulfurase middle domain-containing protein n=1 Tax=Xanthoceras sorbifolium TaxID=99658 RepID=A0ABQ8HK00_9ROSI|nr:hypothetical protein JRO89_XS09G0004900 [Xanthoceras sorbifolium]
MLTLPSQRGSRFCDLILPRVRESLVAVAKGEVLVHVRRERSPRGETVSETNCASFAMADRVDSAVQRRGIRRERSPLRQMEAGITVEHLTQLRPAIRAPCMNVLKISLSRPRDVTNGVSVWEWSGSAMDEGAEAANWFTNYPLSKINNLRNYIWLLY